MAETWPASMPQELILGHTEGPTEDVAEFQPMVGYPLLTQTGRSQRRRISGHVRVTDAQRETFFVWFRDTLLSGTKQFDWGFSAAWSDSQEWRLQFEARNPYSLEAMPSGWILRLNLVFVRRVA